MYRTLDDFGDRYVVVPPEEGVSLATLGVLPYSPPDPAWEDDGRMPAAPDMEAPGGSFADLVRTISPVAEPGVWRDDNRVPFWSPDDPRVMSSPSFDDFVRTNDPRAVPDVWASDAPRYAGWGDPERYAAPYGPRAVALGAVRIPGLPEDAAEWGSQERSPGRGGDAETPAQLASILERWIGLGMLGADFTPHERGGYPSVGGGGGGGGGGGRGGGSSGTGRAAGTSGSSDRYIPGADAAGEGPNGPILNGYVYRSGGSNPGSWKVKPGQDYSVRDTPSNPWPMRDTGPVFRVGKKITEVDAAKLPPGSVVRDNIPPGHVNIDGSLLWDLIQKAIKKRP